jgi:F-type H+-transporting ATPase subunit delta
MDKTKLYAKALYELSGENSGQILEQMEIVKYCFGEGLLKLLNNPLVDNKRKSEILKKILGGKVSNGVLNLLTILINENNVDHFSDIKNAYEKILKQNEDIAYGEVVSATPLEKNVMEKITVKLGEKMKKDVRLENKVDVSVIGGILIKVGDESFDNTIKRKINDLYLKLSN